MKRFVESQDRRQSTLLPERLDDFVADDNPVRVIEALIDELDLGALGFDGVMPEATGRPAYHPVVLLKVYVYDYLNRVQSNRRLEREAGRNIELMWLTGHLAPDFKTIADFRRYNGPAMLAMCGQFVVLCRSLSMFLIIFVAAPFEAALRTIQEDEALGIHVALPDPSFATMPGHIRSVLLGRP